MSDDNEVLVQDELETLKARADMLGIQYHPSIGLEKLRAKVAAAVSADAPQPEPEVKAPAAAAPAVVPETPGQKRFRMKQEANKLVRIRVACMNPAKSEWAGEIFTTGNKAVGSIKKYVPFNADEGWHVPYMIYEMMRDRQCQIFTTVTDARGNKVRRGKMIKEFAIEVLPQLTEEEIAELARRQALAKSID